MQNRVQGKPRVPKRAVDGYVELLDKQFRHPVSRRIMFVAIPVVFFSVLGLVWMIPFPEVDFLRKGGYDTFLNWASFYIAAIIYYYLRLSPTLSYAMLFTIALFSFFIVQLEYAALAGGPPVWAICVGLLVVAGVAMYRINRFERNPFSLQHIGKLLILGPIWIWHFAFKRWNIPY